jgi:multicomponent Na+:H+ antiporter subunit D
MSDLSSLQLMQACLWIPLLTVLLVTLTGRWPNLRDGLSLLGGVALAAVSLCQAARFMDGAGAMPPSPQLFAPLANQPGLEMLFALEPLGVMFSALVGVLWPITTLFAISYMRGNKERSQTRFFACFALAILAAEGIALSGNLLTSFIFYEMMTIGTYALVVHSMTDEARHSGRIYLGLLMGTSLLFFLPAIWWSFALTGSTAYQAGGLLASINSPWLGLLLALFMFGIGKAALMPFHSWLPAAMVAPTPVSALLHAVAVVKSGVFLVVKVLLYVFGVDHLRQLSVNGLWMVSDWLPYVAAVTVVLGSAVALRHDNLKKRLAYSTVAQLGYVVLAASILLPYSVLGAALHITAHAFGKITLFFAAGSIYTASGKKYVSQLDGIGRMMPWTMGAFAVASLSMIGVPPTVGFLSKWYMLKGMLVAEHWVALAAIAASTLLNAAYLLPIIYHAFFVAPDSKKPAHGEAPLTIRLAIVATAFGVVALFFWPEPLVLLESSLLGGTVPAY